MPIEWTCPSKDAYSCYEHARFITESGEKMAAAGFTTLDSRYCGGWLKALLVGGIHTEPEYRRSGCVRQMLDKAFSLAPERGWAVSFLHPFSFSYYRKFGYEKLSDHRILDFPLSALEHIPRCSGLKLLTSSQLLPDVLSVYEQFSLHRNILFRRYNARHYSLQPHKDNRYTYLWYDPDGIPAGYVTLSTEKYFKVNRMDGVCLHVHELIFTSPQSLLSLLGFLRMFDGELEKVRIENCGMSPEVDFFLRHYPHTQYALVPDVMGRILDVGAVLAANFYPKERGGFVLKVEDTLPFTQGTYQVEYENHSAQITRLSDGSRYDIRAEMPALTQLLYGYDHYTPETLPYLQGVEIAGSCEDFLRAFPKRNNGVLEHF